MPGFRAQRAAILLALAALGCAAGGAPPARGPGGRDGEREPDATRPAGPRRGERETVRLVSLDAETAAVRPGGGMEEAALAVFWARVVDGKGEGAPDVRVAFSLEPGLGNFKDVIFDPSQQRLHQFV